MDMHRAFAKLGLELRVLSDAPAAGESTTFREAWSRWIPVRGKHPQAESSMLLHTTWSLRELSTVYCSAVVVWSQNMAFYSIYPTIL